MPERAPFAPVDVALRRLVEAVRASGYAFTTMTPASHARVNARPENATANDLTGVFGWSRPFRAGVVPADLFGLMGEAEVLARAPEGWRSTIRLSSLGGDVFAHSAFPTIAADAVFFGPDTYRFAACVAEHLAREPGTVRRAVDIGSGAGPGAIAVARAWPDAEVLMVDINEQALRLSRINSAVAGTARVVAHRSDLLAGVDGLFDLIVANPPYLLDPAERAYRHGGGARGEGLSLAILDAAMSRLMPDGTLLLYTGVVIENGVDAFAASAAARLAGREFAWRYRELDPDVFGEELAHVAYQQADRIAAVLLTVKKAK